MAALRRCLGTGCVLNLALQNMEFAPNVLANWSAGERVLTIYALLRWPLCSMLPFSVYCRGI